MDHIGFHVYRRAFGGSWKRITDRLVVGSPRYSYHDSAPAGFRYQYEIESLSRTGEAQRFGPVEVHIPVIAEVTLRAAPNPTTGLTTISYALSTAGSASIRVFDLSGRQVRILEDSPQSVGEHEVIWDGLDTSGRSVSSGLYFVRLKTESTSRVVRVVLAR